MRQAQSIISFRGVVASVVGPCALLALAGCSGLTPPSFAVQSVAITEQTSDGVVLTFTVEGENRNAEPLPLREVEYALWLDGREVFRGKRSAEVTLSRFSTRTISLPVAAPTEAGGWSPTGVLPYHFSGTVIYETPGAIAETLFDASVRRPSASFAESGSLDFSGPRDDMIGPRQD